MKRLTQKEMQTLNEAKDGNKPIFVMMSAIPGSGKSTKADLIKEFLGNCEISCPDTFRGLLSPAGDEADQSVSKPAWKMAEDFARDCLLAGKNVILDATGITAIARRRELYNICNGLDVTKVSCEVLVSLKTAKERNKNRDRQVPEEVIERMFDRYEKPIKEEGFDYLISINNEM